MNRHLNMKEYNAYKDSGVKWLGEIPEHWAVECGKWLFVKNERPVRKEDGVVTCFRDGQVTLRSNRRTDGFTNALKEHGYQGIRKGDLVIHAMDAFAGAIGVSDSDGKSTPVYSACTERVKGTINEYYYAYFMRSLALNGIIVALAKGIRERSTDFRFNDFGSLQLSYPPLQEQTAIANFLDEKTAKIDKAIAQKERLIELLKERKQILIQELVTGKKVWNKAQKAWAEPAEVKDSGVEWIGEIPEHWEVKKVKHCAHVVLGKMICNQNLGGMELKPYLKSKNIQWLKVDVSSVDEMWFTKQEMEQYRLKKDDLVLSEGGEVGKTCIWNNELPECYIQNSAHKVTINADGDPFFYLYLFNHIGKKGGFDSIINRVSIGHLTKDKLLNIEVVKPPIQEQTTIVANIETQFTKIDRAIFLQETQIEKLKEYKSTLINSAVTGKIKVC